MSGYKPLNIKSNETGLVQNRQNFLLPEDAYPTLENAFLFREQIRRKQGYQLLGRLKRSIGPSAFGVLDGIGHINANIISFFSLETNASIVPGTLVLTIGGNDFKDINVFIIPNPPPNGNIYGTTGNIRGTVNYATGEVDFTFLGLAGFAVFLTVEYYPNLPVMGLRLREMTNTNDEETVAFDTVYAYRFLANGWEEFLPGTTWSGSNSQFFWSTNYWVGDGNAKIFWVTNFNDPIRYTNGQVATNWINFSPVIDSSGGLLINCLCLLPFRGRLVAFNTIETAGTFTNRIRWAEIGNPFNVVSAIVTQVVAEAWRDDIRGKGGFLDIPTSEDIISVGFVRDNLVVYCERSTWQLRYTGRSISPFQIEKVNSELGVESTFSSVQFDTSLVGIGDKGVVECDSYKSKRIDVKIPDLVFEFNNKNSGTTRVHGVRDFVQRLAYWIYPFKDNDGVFPDRRLVYNYENDSWAIFTDSLTCLGTFQPPDTRTWQNTVKTWEELNITWSNQPAQIPAIVGGNQQGWVEYIGGSLESGQTTNDPSLYIKNITGNGTTPTSLSVVINSPDNNLQTGQIIKITAIPAGTSFATLLNNGIFQVNLPLNVPFPSDNFYLTSYDSTSGKYITPVLANSATYIGGGQMAVRDNFRIVSKKFNYMDQGKQFQLGYIDILMNKTESGAIALNIYNDYSDSSPTNKAPLNQSNDTFFNSVIPTSNLDPLAIDGGTKNWKRVFCATNSNFITIEYTLNNEQMQNQCQESDVQIDAQVIWNRVGGRLGLCN